MDTIKHSFVLSLVSLYTLFRAEELQGLGALMEQDTLNHAVVASYIQKSELLLWIASPKKYKQYLSFVSRSFVIQLYELCKQSPHFQHFKNQDWFVFLANLRHAFAHGVHGNWRITFYGKKHIVYTRQVDLQSFTINPYWDNSSIKAEQYGGLLTIWDLTHYVENFVLSI